jgi:hypothetical protein
MKAQRAKKVKVKTGESRNIQYQQCSSDFSSFRFKADSAALILVIHFQFLNFCLQNLYCAYKL